MTALAAWFARWFPLGRAEYTRLVEVEEPFLRPEQMFPTAPPAALAAAVRELGDGAVCARSGRLILPVQSFILRTGRFVALVDSCIGNHKSFAGFKRWADRDDRHFAERLAALGLQPADIDYVLCTHLHLDHCGWHTQRVDGRWVPTFPNARYVFARAELDYAERQYREKGDPVYLENVLPVLDAGLATIVDGEHAVADGLEIEPTPGHTPGHCAVHLRSAGEHAVVTGDLIHSELQCAHPAWNFQFDELPARATATRRAFLERHADTATWILASHFPSPSVGRIRSRGDAFGFEYRA